MLKMLCESFYIRDSKGTQDFGGKDENTAEDFYEQGIILAQIQ